MPKRPITAVLAALALLAAAAPAASHAQDPPADAPRAKRSRRSTRTTATTARSTPATTSVEDLQDGAGHDRAGVRPGLSRTSGPRSRRASTTTTTTAATTTRTRSRPRPRRRRPTATQHAGRRRAPADRRRRRRPTTPARIPPRGRHAPARGRDRGARGRRRHARPRRPPTAAPPAAATTPAASPTPVIVTRSGTDGLLIPGILLGIALLGALALGAVRARRPPLAAVRARVARSRVQNPRNVGGLLGLAQARPLTSRRKCGLPHPAETVVASTVLPPDKTFVCRDFSSRIDGADTTATPPVVPSETRCIVTARRLRSVPGVGTEGRSQRWNRRRRRPHSTQQPRPAEALSVRRLFTRPGVHPFETVEWELRTAAVGSFRQENVEFPKYVVAERDEHRRPEVLPRAAHLADARALGQADGRARRRARSPTGAVSAATSPPRRTRTRSRPS